MATPNISGTILPLIGRTSRRKVSIRFPWLKLLKHYDEGKNPLTSSSWDPRFIEFEDYVSSDLFNFQTQTTYESMSKDDQHAKLKVALVDLTGARKKTRPEFIGLQDTDMIEAGSVAKLGVIYAAHQLQWDLTVRSMETPKPTLGDIFREWLAAGLTNQEVPNLWKIFLLDRDLNKELPDTIEFQPDITSLPHFKHISFIDLLKKMPGGSIPEMNQAASDAIDLVGFPYIASALWQSGLYDIMKGGGLWLGGDYPRPLNPEPNKFWHYDPVTKNKLKPGHGVTARAAATFYTLLAQDRLVNAEASASMKDVLKVGWEKASIFRKAFAEKDSKDRYDGYSKIGLLKKRIEGDGDDSDDDDDKLFDTLVHDTALIERVTETRKQTRYVAVVLSQSVKGFKHRFVRDLIKKLDFIIEKNN